MWRTDNLQRIEIYSYYVIPHGFTNTNISREKQGKMLRKLIFLGIFLSAMSAFSFATTPDMGGFDEVFYTPVGRPYDTRALRPPIWTANRWEGGYADQNIVQFQNSPANGTDVSFPLALKVIDGSSTFYYPILYVNEEKLHIYTLAVGVSEIDHSHWSVNQGTGVITLDEAPFDLTQVYFELQNE